MSTGKQNILQDARWRYLVRSGLPAVSRNKTVFFIVAKKCRSRALEQSRNGSHSVITNLCKNIPEHSISYVIIQIRNCVKLLNLAPSRSFSNSLISHQVKRKKITTVKEVWIPGLN